MTESSAVHIVGVGMTPVREHWDRSLRDLAFDAMQAARTEAGGLVPQALYVANMLAGPLSGQAQLGAILADYAGLRGIEAHTVEAAGASGGLALRQAYLAIRSGEVEVALVVGVEKVSEKVRAEIDAALISASDTDFEAVQGITPTAQAALVMRRYLHQYQAPDDALAGFSLNAHANAVGNPNAMFQREISLESYQRGGMISEPVGMFDAAPLADGAAALLLVNADRLPQGELPAIRVAGSASATSAVALHDQPDPLWLETVHRASQMALERANLELDQVDFFELHDLFTIHAALALEASGYAERGHGWQLAANGVINRDGRIPICTMGGSKARGDSGGATGVYQAAEAVRQLQGRAGPAQLKAASVGMVQAVSGNGATCATHLLMRDA